MAYSTYNEKVTPSDFMTEKAVKVLMDILNSLKPFYSEGCSRLNIGVTSTHYENDSIPMEAFARPLWGLVPFWAGGSSDLEFDHIYRIGLTNGPDPGHPEY